MQYKKLKDMKKYNNIIIEEHLNNIERFLYDKDYSNCFYLPLEEGVISLKFDNNIFYFYFNNETVEFYRYNKDTYTFHGIYIIKFSMGNKDKFNFSILDNAFKLKVKSFKHYVQEFVTLILYINYIKDNRNIEYKRIKNKKMNDRNIKKSNNNKDYKNIINIQQDNIVYYSLKIDGKSYKSFKTFVRKTDSWNVIGHYRHYKSGKVVFIKPYMKGNKNKDKINKKSYIIK